MKLPLILLLLALLGCQGAIETTHDAAERLTYFKDTRTNLCFAQVVSDTKDGWQVVCITNVPCDQVSNYLLKD